MTLAEGRATVHARQRWTTSNHLSHQLPQMLHRPNRRFHPRPQSKLMQQVLHMNFNRAFGDAEFVADDFVAVAGGDGFQHLAFAVGEVDVGGGVGRA